MKFSRETLQIFADLLSQCSVSGQLPADEIENAARRLATANRELAIAMRELESPS